MSPLSISRIPGHSLCCWIQFSNIYIVPSTNGCMVYPQLLHSLVKKNLCVHIAHHLTEIPNRNNLSKIILSSLANDDIESFQCHSMVDIIAKQTYNTKLQNSDQGSCIELEIRTVI